MRKPRVHCMKWDQSQGKFGKPWYPTEYSFNIHIPVYPNRWIHIKFVWAVYPNDAQQKKTLAKMKLNSEY